MIKIIGFRSVVWWKKVLTVIWCLSLIITFYFNFTGITWYDIALNETIKILFLLIPFLFFVNFNKLKDRLSFLKRGRISGTIYYLLIYLFTFALVYFGSTLLYSPEEQAYRAVHNAKVFSCGSVSYAGIMAREVHAYSKLFQSNDSKKLFLMLEKDDKMRANYIHYVRCITLITIIITKKLKSML